MPVHLTSAKLDLIEQHFHKSGVGDIRLRCHAIILSHKGYSFAQIAEILFIGEQAIYRWIKAFQKERISSLFPRTLGN